MRNALDRITSALPDCRILVFGDLTADKFIWGDKLRICEEAPVLAMRLAEERCDVGGAARVAHFIRRLGAEVLLCGIVGFDDAAFSLRQSITRNGIGAGGLFPSETRPTTLSVRLMSKEHEQLLFRIDSESADPLTEAEIASIRGYVIAVLSEVTTITLGDFQRGMFGVRKFTRWLLDSARQAGVKTVALARPSSLGSFAGASVIISTASSAREFLYLKGRGYPKDLRAAGSEMCQLLQCESFVIIDEAEGLLGWDRDGGRTFHRFKTHKPAQRWGLEETVVSVISASVAVGFELDAALRVAALEASKLATREQSTQLTAEDLRVISEKDAGSRG